MLRSNFFSFCTHSLLRRDAIIVGATMKALSACRPRKCVVCRCIAGGCTSDGEREFSTLYVWYVSELQFQFGRLRDSFHFY